MGSKEESTPPQAESLGLINAVTTLIKAKLALWEAAETVEDFIGFKVDADDGHDGPLGWYCACLGGEVEDVKAAHALGLIASLREAKKGEYQNGQQRGECTNTGRESGVGGSSGGDAQS